MSQALLAAALCTLWACPAPPAEQPPQPTPDPESPSTPPTGSWAPGAPGSTPPSVIRPHIPAVLPDLVLVENGVYTRPTLPPHRTSSDGRIAVSLNEPTLYLMRPESLTTPLALADPGTVVAAEAHAFPDDALYDPQAYSDLGATDVLPSHQTLCDPIVTTPGQVPQGTPSPCADEPTADCYDLTVWSSVEFRAPDGPRDTQLWSVPLTVRVADAKTDSAHIVQWSLGEPEAGPVVYAKSIREPMITGDGRLVVLRASKTTRDPSTGARIDAPFDMVYASIPTTSDPCDLGALGPLYPMSHAHHDPEVFGRYGFATYPLRDPQGDPIADGDDLRASYPWIDRTGANLFFTTVGAPNASVIDGEETLRYSAVCAHADDCEGPQGVGVEPVLNFRGYGVAGLWTRGKMVLLDTVVNNIDYGILRRRGAHQDLRLYAPRTHPDPAVRDDGWLEVGSGRDVSGIDVPELSSRNTSVFDSPEALWNYDADLHPTRVRDVVWHVTTGRTTDQIVFDDFLDEDVLLRVDMVGALSHPEGTDVGLRYYDGYLRTVLTDWTVDAVGPEHVRLQNAATSTRWQVPRYGSVHGPVRLEPVAAGGVVGKGLWLDGPSASARFMLPPQTSADLDDAAYMVGVFIDARVPPTPEEHRVLTLPAGGSLSLEGLDAVVLRDGDGAVIDRVALGALALSPAAYRHLAVQVDPLADTLTLWLDGYPLHTSARSAGWALQPGDVVLGEGLSGWVDELMLVLGEQGPELMCNRAHGTLVGLDGSEPAGWWQTAGHYPSHDALTARLQALQQATFPRYACWVEPADLDAVQLRSPPAGALSLRSALLTPDEELVWDLPRPDSTANGFCLSCHTDATGSLSPEALTADPSTAMTDDPRRQPLQPPRLLFGTVPADFFGPGQPPTPSYAPYLVIDPWIYP